MSSVKACAKCGGDFDRRARDSAAQWAGRRYCSQACANGSREMVPLAERFWAKVGVVDNVDLCWVWLGSTDGRGYGQIAAGRRGEGPLKASRVSWEIHNGPIPAGLVVRHKCDNPTCVNPAHLELGTQKDNSMDTSRRGRLNPSSLLNLRPGAAGFLGAGPKSNGEIKCQRA